MANVYTMEEVARHNKETDLWMVIHDKVYDLTKFLMEHPGGAEVLMNMAGKDGTACFDDIGHSQEAIVLQENYKIGVISKEGTSTASSSSQVMTERTVDDDNWEYVEVKKESSALLPAIIALGVLIYAIIFYYYFF